LLSSNKNRQCEFFLGNILFPLGYQKPLGRKRTIV